MAQGFLVPWPGFEQKRLIDFLHTKKSVFGTLCMYKHIYIIKTNQCPWFNTFKQLLELIILHGPEIEE